MIETTSLFIDYKYFNNQIQVSNDDEDYEEGNMKIFDLFLKIFKQFSSVLQVISDLSFMVFLSIILIFFSQINNFANKY